MEQNIYMTCPDKTNDTSCWTCRRFFRCEKVIAYFKEKDMRFDEMAFRALDETEKTRFNHEGRYQHEPRY